MALDLTTFDAALKQHYTADRVENMVYRDNPFLALVPKMEMFGGRNLPIPIVYGNPQGRSATFATAQANKNNSLVEDFVLTRARDYSLADIDNETLKASEGNANAFMEAATTEIDGAIQAITRSLAISLYRSGSGSIGQVGSGETTTTITLANINDVTNFEVGMELQFDSVDGGGTVHAGTATVTAVDRDAGTITSDATFSSQITGIAANDYIFQHGDYDAKLSGLAAWVPTSAPGATAFFGVDRSVDPTRLGGIRYDGSAQPIEEALIDGASRVAREGGAPTHCFMNFVKYAELEKALQAKVRYEDVEVPSAEFGFRALVLSGPRGPIRVFPDHNCPSGQAYLLDLSVWKLYSLGAAPHILETDGLRVLRNASSDSVEVRVGYYAQLGCRAPGWNAVVTLP